MTDAGQMIKTWLTNPAIRGRLDQALMGWLPADAFAEQCIMVAQDSKLARCSPDSLLAAFLKCAQLALMPGPQKLVHLIARGGAVDVMIGARGFKVLMERLPEVRRVKAVLVHVGDDWGAPDEDNRPNHSPDPLRPGRSFKSGDDLRGGYLHATFTDGTEDWHYVTAEEIDECRQCAKSQTVWRQWFGRMALKTIYRQAWARMFLPSGSGPGLESLPTRADGTPAGPAEALVLADLSDRDAMQEHWSHKADHQEASRAAAPAARALTYDNPAPAGPPQDAGRDPGGVGAE